MAKQVNRKNTALRAAMKKDVALVLDELETLIGRHLKRRAG